MTPPVGWPVVRLRWLIAAQAVSVAAILVAGRAAAGQAAVGDQVPWVSLAVTAAVVSGAGNALWLLHLRRATGLRSRALLASMAAGATEADLAPVDPAAPEADAPLVAVPGMTLVHRPGCLLVVGKRTEPAGRDAGDREPCGWCRA